MKIKNKMRDIVVAQFIGHKEVQGKGSDRFLNLSTTAPNHTVQKFRVCVRNIYTICDSLIKNFLPLKLTPVTLQKVNNNLQFILQVFLFMLFVVFLGCSKGENTNYKIADKSANYILLEKQLADINVGKIIRHRTTAKIVIKNQKSEDRNQKTEKTLNLKSQQKVATDLQVGYKKNIENILKQALTDILTDDPTINAVIIWAYKDRKELNQSFTLGKLEYSKDKKGFDGKQKLAQEIIIETR